MIPVAAVAVAVVVDVDVVSAGAVAVIVAIVYDGGTLSEGDSEVWLSCRDSVRERGGCEGAIGPRLPCSALPGL